MGVNRPSSSTPPAFSSSLWSVSSPATLACVARPTGAVDLYALPSGRRVSATALRIDPANGRPTAVAVRPPANPSTHAMVAIGTSAGMLHLDETLISHRLRAAVCAVSYGVDLIVAVDRANNVMSIHPGKRTVIARFSLAHLHAVPISRVLCVTKQAVVFASQVVTVGYAHGGELFTNGNGSENTSKIQRKTSPQKQQVMSVKLGQHQTPVSSLATIHTTANHLVLSACDADSFICAWKFDDLDQKHGHGQDHDSEKAQTNPKRRRPTIPSSTSTSTSAAAATLVAPASGIVHLATDDTSGAIAALLRDGNVAVWRRGALMKNGASIVDNTTSSGGNLPIPAAFVIRASSMSGQVFIAAFAKRAKLTLLHGAQLKPSAHTVSVEGEHDHDLARQNIVDSSQNLDLPAVDADTFLDRTELAKKKEHAEKLNSTVDGNTQAEYIVSDVAPAQAIGTKTKSNSKADPQGTENDTDIASKSKMKRKQNGRKTNHGDDDDDDDDVDESAEPSLQEKLATLGISASDIESKSGSGKQNRTSAEDVKKSVTNVNSRVSVLLQAIRSNDSQLLSACLRSANKYDIIEATVVRIPPAVASGPLLETLVERMRTNWRDTLRLSMWIKIILTEHAAAIATSDHNRALTALLAVVSNRTRTFGALAQLHGRLELVTAQAEKVQSHMAVIDERNARREYIEEDEEEGEDEEEEDEEEEEVEDEYEKDGEESDDDDDDDDDNDDQDVEMENPVERVKTISKTKDIEMNGSMEDESEDEDDEDSE